MLTLTLLAMILGATPKPIVLPAMTLSIGEARTLALPCQVQRILIGDASTYDVKALGENRVQVIGAQLGRSMLLMWCTNEQRVSLEIRVVDAPVGEVPVKVEQREVSATVIDQRGVRDTKVTLIEVPGELHGVTEVAGADGGFSYVGFDENGRRVSITLKEYRPRARTD